MTNCACCQEDSEHLPVAKPWYPLAAALINAPLPAGCQPHHSKGCQLSDMWGKADTVEGRVAQYIHEWRGPKIENQWRSYVKSKLEHEHQFERKWQHALQSSFCGWSSILNVLHVWALSWLTARCWVSGTNGSVVCIYLQVCITHV